MSVTNTGDNTVVVSLDRSDFVNWVNQEEGTQEAEKKFRDIGVSLTAQPHLGHYGSVNGITLILKPNGPMKTIKSIRFSSENKDLHLKQGWHATNSSGWLRFFLPEEQMQAIWRNNDELSASIAIEFARKPTRG